MVLISAATNIKEGIIKYQVYELFLHSRINRISCYKIRQLKKESRKNNARYIDGLQLLTIE